MLRLIVLSWLVTTAAMPVRAMAGEWPSDENVATDCAALSMIIKKDIPAQQDVRTVLETVSRDLNLQLVYSSYLAKGAYSPAVASKGKTAKQTFDEVLRGTNLHVECVNDHTLTVVQTVPPAAQQDVAAAGNEILNNHAQRLMTHQRDEHGDPLIVVTGTHLYGEEPVGAQVIRIDREQIDDSGAATVQDLLRTLPQNFGGGPSEDTYLGRDSIGNASRGTGANLRAVGSSATLVLLNGRRLAPSGSDGRFVDISALPLSAIERIEVLPDGASAIYGADAVGGVINFILKQNFRGSESQVRQGGVTQGSTTETQLVQTFGSRWSEGNGLISVEYYTRDALPAAQRSYLASSDLRPLGGDNFDTIEGNPGTIVAGAQTWAVPRGQDGRSLQPSDLVAGTQNTSNRNAGRDVLPEHQRWTLVSTVRQNLNDSAQLFADLLLSRRTAQLRNPAARQIISVPESNPHYVDVTEQGGPIAVAYNFERDFGVERDQAAVSMNSATLGSTLQLRGEWSAVGYLTYSQSDDHVHGAAVINQEALAAALADPDPATAFNPFGDGSFTPRATLEAIADDAFLQREAILWGGNLTVQGPLMDLGSDRPVQLALGADYRSHTFRSRAEQGEALLRDLDLHRTVTALFGELRIPLVVPRQGRRGLRRAELSLAARRENYTAFGDSLTPKIGAAWWPAQHLRVRSTWSRSSRAPHLADLDESDAQAIIDAQRDPRSPTGVAPVLLWSGGNSDLDKESATTLTVGTDLRIPTRLLALSLAYFRIHFADRIDVVDYSSDFLTDPAYAGRVLRDPTADQLARVCNSARFLGTQPCIDSSVAAIVDMRLRNVSAITTSGLDFRVQHTVESAMGRLELASSGTYVLGYSQAQSSSAPAIDLLDTPGNPLRLRMRSSLSWQRGAWRVAGALNFANAYRDRASTPQRPISPWTTVDTQVRYGRGREEENGFAIMLNVENLTDNDPPFVNNPAGVGYDPANADPLGRLVSLTLRKRW